MKIKNKIRNNFPLKELTTFKIGGPAEFFVAVENKNDLEKAVLWAKENNKKITILGGGSNILVNDKGVPGLVIKINIADIDVNNNLIKAGAGLTLGNLVNFAGEHDLSGMEWAAGIPGTVGGAARGNAGAFGQSISDNIEIVEIFDLAQTKFLAYSRDNCDFVYRQSIFKTNKNLIILYCRLRLQPGNKEEIKNKIFSNLKHRFIKHPKQPSAGSIFKNISKNDLLKINQELLIKAESEGVVKAGLIPAGWIIDQLDLRNLAIGGAKISNEHANIIINNGQATAEEIITLICLVKTKIRDNFNLQLCEEIEYLGF